MPVSLSESGFWDWRDQVGICGNLLYWADLLIGESAVMSYNDEGLKAWGERGWPPDPLDVMALWALYQTVGNVGGGDE